VHLMMKVVIEALFGVSANVHFCQSFSVHKVGHLVILTSPMHQSISGLCSMSHIFPRMIVVWPMP